MHSNQSLITRQTTKTLRLIVALIIPCAAAGLAGTESETAPAKWQTSWDAFADLFQEHLSSGAHVSNFENQVVGRLVTWEGTLKELKQPTFTFGGASDQWFATLDFGPRRVRMKDIDLRVIPPPLAVNAEELPRWQSLREGTTVRVRLHLQTRNFLHTLFFTDTRKAGEELVSFMAQEGELVEVLKVPDPAGAQKSNP